MTYEETLSYLYQQLPMFSRIGAAAYKKDLNNIKSLCQVLGNPQEKQKYIHVAGTNGKGSTSHMLAAILQEAGYKTGLYTSPHIKDFGERIRINGEMINTNFVINFVASNKKIFDEISPSFFEVTVAMAFEYFLKEKTDIVIIETGIGGRLDSTNIIDPILSVITNISYDHMDILGESLPEIAKEKAGIIKKNIPVVIGEINKETKDIFIEASNEMLSPIHFAEEKYLVEYIDHEGALLLCNIKNLETNVVEKLRLDLVGTYQSKNARTVLGCVDVLRKAGITIPQKALHAGLENVKGLTGFQGRWDFIQKDPIVIIDAAHNEGGIKQVIEQLYDVYPGNNYHFILGFVKDKDISRLLKLFPTESSFYFTNAHIPRALQHSELKSLAGKEELQGEGYDDVNEAIAAAIQKASKEDVIIICGSFFILGEITM
ncbi:MAG: folylpolyglutamate synthase/dihydrofolate synthase family protein [Ferruginibacter sp.]